jgi:hypothetical protein
VDKHLHSGSDEKRNEIEQLRLKEIELRDEIRLRAAEAASAKSDAAALISNLTTDVLELTLRIKRHEDATSRDADVSVANSKSAENRLRTALDEALGSQKNERAENDRLREKLERLESVRRDFDELSRRADSDVADAEDRADNATRRAEKAENALRRVDEKTNRSAHERDAARDAEAATKRELETVKSALAAAGATRDADAALAREFADREAALAVAAADVARADAESRARKAHDALTCANRRRDELESDNRRLVGELAGVRDELKAHAGASHVVSRLEMELAQTQDSFQSMEREKLRLERVVVEAHAERTAVVAAATATAEREAHRQRSVAQEATRARLEAEAASYRASKERDALSDTVRIAETQMKAATIAEARARRELAAERSPAKPRTWRSPISASRRRAWRGKSKTRGKARRGWNNNGAAPPNTRAPKHQRCLGTRLTKPKAWRVRDVTLTRSEKKRDRTRRAIGRETSLPSTRASGSIRRKRGSRPDLLST